MKFIAHLVEAKPPWFSKSCFEGAKGRNNRGREWEKFRYLLVKRQHVFFSVPSSLAYAAPPRAGDGNFGSFGECKFCRLLVSHVRPFIQLNEAKRRSRVRDQQQLATFGPFETRCGIFFRPQPALDKTDHGENGNAFDWQTKQTVDTLESNFLESDKSKEFILSIWALITLE